MKIPLQALEAAEALEKGESFTRLRLIRQAELKKVRSLHGTKPLGRTFAKLGGKAHRRDIAKHFWSNQATDFSIEKVLRDRARSR